MACLFHSSHDLQRFTLDEAGRWMLYFGDEPGGAARLVSAWVLADRLLALSWRTMDHRRVSVWVLRRSVCAESWRRLIVRLRIPIAAGQRGERTE